MQMSEFGKLMGLCQNCVRYNPKGVATCLMAKDIGYLASKWKNFNLMVTECNEFLIPKEVFPLPESERGENGNEVVVDAVLKEKDEK
jgi:hypothetical protein